MSTLRIEFYHRVLPINDQARDPIQTITLSVGNIPTLPFVQPVVPSTPEGEVIAVFYAVDGPVYIDIGPNPDPKTSKTLINKGTQLAVNVSPGDNISGMTAFDIPQQADSVIGPITGVINAQVDTSLPLGRLFGISCTVAGVVRLKLLDGSTFDLMVYIGFQSFPLSVLQVVSNGTTATATYVVML